MLTALRIGNFKAFAETQQVPVRPLTLIYGANSAGKSSVLHALLLARHALETGELDVHRTAIGGESVDLGGFRQYVHRREPSRRVELTLDLDVARLTGPLKEAQFLPSHKAQGIQVFKMRERLAELLAPVRTISLSVRIGAASDDHGVPIAGVAPQVVLYEILADGSTVVRMSRRPDGMLRLDRLDPSHPVVRLLLNSIVQTCTTTEALRESDFEGLDEAINKIVPEIAATADLLLPRGVLVSGLLTHEGQQTLFPVSIGNRREDLANAVRFYLPKWLDDLIRGLGDSVAGELSRIRYLGPLRSYPPRHLAFAQHHDPNWYAGGGYAWDVVRRDDHVRSLVNAWLNSPDRLQTRYQLVLRDLIGLDQIEGPLLAGLERMNEEGLDLKHEMDEDQTGSTWPVIKDPEAEAARLRDTIRAADIEKLNELVLMDVDRKTPVSHRDVGIGVSQVLPVLVSAYALKDQIVAIEQPEIHLHPGIQADLADVFIESSRDQQNHFLIETHSEHLLLRVMRRMRETFEKRLPNGLRPLTPDHVSLLFVERDGTQSIVREMPLNERGDLVKAWPRGFFEEGLREVFS